jgi:hypothetical protein
MHIFEASELERPELFGGADSESLKTLVEMVQKSLLPSRRGEARAAAPTASQDPPVSVE